MSQLTWTAEMTSWKKNTIIVYIGISGKYEYKGSCLLLYLIRWL